MSRSGWAVVLTVVAAAQAWAQVPASCDEQRPVDKYQLLRRVFLDLRGRAPTPAEYASLDALDVDGGVPSALIDAALASDEFRLVMRRVHEEQLWPNVSNVRLVGATVGLTGAVIDTGRVSTTPDGGTLVYFRASTGVRRVYRGDEQPESPTLGRDCGDYQQTQFDPAYPNQFRPLPSAVRLYDAGVGVGVIRQEGWRWVQPYWLPAGQQIRVCAYDAQQTPSYTVGSTTVSCDGTVNRAECGCGPNLRECHGPAADTRVPLLNAFREQISRAVDKVSRGGRPYTDLLLSTKTDVNGPISYWKRNQSDLYAISLAFTRADALEASGGVPVLPFTADETWLEQERGGLHAGVLTMPAYLLRFQTNRGRANRFQLAFECEGFEPPDELEAQGDRRYGDQSACTVNTTDLTKKCTCRYCHTRLEPLAAGWGQFTEAGLSHMDTAAFPRVDPNCVLNPNGTPKPGVAAKRLAECRRFYVVDPDQDNPGALIPYQYAVNSTATAERYHKAIYDAFQGGPRRRANTIIANGTFARCTTKRFFNYLLKRDAREAGQQSEAALLNQLATTFRTSNYDLPTLLRAIVNTDEYRRLR